MNRLVKRLAVEVVPLRLEHLDELGHPDPACLGPYAYAGLRGGKCIAAAGITESWVGRGYAWFFENGLTKREWVEVTRLIKNALDSADFRRVEAAVYDSHDAGHRWASRLGFHLESVCSQYMPNGETGRLYVRFKE